MSVKRNYNSKDVDMLLAASTIVENAIKQKVALQSQQTTWTGAYFENLKIKIDQALQTYLGIDSASKMRQATAAIKSIQKVALNDLAKVKVSIMGKLKSKKEAHAELLRQLGFSSYLKQAQSRNQESLINLLYQFKLNLTPIVRNQLTTQTGVPDILLTTIIGYADHLKDANVGQEVNKGARKTITQDAIIAFNEVYDAIILISKIAAKTFKDDPVLKGLFNYSKILKRLGGNSKPTPPDELPSGK